jgi:hypothetical protein
MLIEHTGELLVGAEGNVLLVAWLGTPSLPGARVLANASLELARAHPTGIAHLNLIAKTSSTRSLPEDARGAILDLLNDPAHKLVASATVFGDGGFLAATIRGVLAGLTMLARTRAPVKVVASISQAEEILRSALSQGGASVPDVGVIASAAERFQAAAGARGAVFR